MSSFTPAGLPRLSWREFGRWLLRRRRRFRVRERSMMPLLAPGDEILVDERAYDRQLPQVGEIVVARHPTEAILQVKRIAEVLADGRLTLRGDNERESQDSRHYGPVTAAAVIGRVVCRFA